MSLPRLSYVLTTFNKLPYLRHTLPRLLSKCREDEEVVIMDGGSTDGTVEFLRQYHEQGKVHVCLSKPDLGEAHGLNRALMAARGMLIKIVTDDDVFHFDQIFKCRQFMEAHPEVDLIGCDGYYQNLTSTRLPVRNTSLEAFRVWRNMHKPFFFTGLGILIRKDSIPLVGLFDPAFLIVDYEFSLRVTAGKARMAWYSGAVFVNLVTSSSNSQRHWERLYQERHRLARYYGLPDSIWRYAYIMFRSKLSRALKGAPSAVTQVTYEQAFTQAEVLLDQCAVEGEFYW
ncbi:MAG: glycosyltransferase [Cyclobacteriaceae bacterium]|nr:glycosyltransferase [Cyclobacteriaceae bacterium]